MRTMSRGLAVVWRALPGPLGQAAVWRALPGMQQRRSLQMIFTCDASATSGYIDFFDLSQDLGRPPAPTRIASRSRVAFE